MVGRGLASHLVAIRLKAPSYLRDMIKETTTEKCTEVSKSQNIRLVDVFVIAPFLAYVAFKAKGMSLHRLQLGVTPTPAVDALAKMKKVEVRPQLKVALTACVEALSDKSRDNHGQVVALAVETRQERKAVDVLDENMQHRLFR